MRRILVSVARLVLAGLVASTSSPSVLAAGASDGGMARVGPGVYRPLYAASPKGTDIPVEAFLLDRHPVTEGDFLAFVRSHPQWRRDRVPRVFADAGYLSDWTSATELEPDADPDGMKPIVRVSWFAARAYCAGRGARLPTESEWELAAAASRTEADGRGDPQWREQILAWYSRPNAPRLPRVGTTPANYWGVHDLHGLVWEWVLDFNGTMVGTDARKSGDRDRTTFCGGGSVTASDATDYASFMRVAFRSSLRADYTTHNLGFRCAADERGKAP